MVLGAVHISSAIDENSLRVTCRSEDLLVDSLHQLLRRGMPPVCDRKDEVRGYASSVLTHRSFNDERATKTSNSKSADMALVLVGPRPVIRTEAVDPVGHGW
eukprot:CAMPEP_0170585522 /NCGR_PEP_ID=MMETSP0224-20130122/9259_1 /TAXON_ID=285029 /ORGANISM="Togula jolla, Strain CCCM 725" /LENGTH=101 /DNA_ID=CAMNT_0010909013 /DNA_START=699 /DNA_END=1001 /DNA_ORIENTATION=-